MYGTVYGIPSQLLKSGVRKMECMIDQNNDAVRLIRDERDHAGAIAILNRILLLVFHHDLENHDASTTSTTNTIPGGVNATTRMRMPALLTHNRRTDINPPESPQHHYDDHRYDEGMSTFSQPLYIHPSRSTEMLVPVEAIVYFNLGVAHSRQNLQGGEAASVFFEKSRDTIVSRSTIGDLHEIPSVAGLLTPPLHIVLLNVGHGHWAAGHREEAGKAYRHVLQVLHASSESNSEVITGTDDDVSHLQTTRQISQFMSATLNCIAIVNFYELAPRINQNKPESLERMASYCTKLLNDALSPWISLEDCDERQENAGLPSRQYATILNNIGRVHFATENYAKALDFYNGSLQHRRDLLGDEHLDVASTRFNIAQCYEKLGDVPEAISNYESYLLIVISKLGPGNGDVIKVMLILGEIYDRTGQQKRAREVLTQALQHSQQSTSRDDEVVATIFNKLGNVLHDLHEDEAALTAYTAGLEMEKLIYPVYHMNIAITLTNIARVHLNIGSYDRATASLGEALQIMKALEDGGEFETEITNIRSSIAAIHEAQGDYASAIEELKEVLKIKERVLGPDHFQVSVVLNSLGLLQFKAGKTHTSLVSMLKCLNIRKISPESSLQALTTAYYNAACLYKAIGERRQALDFFKEILRLEHEAAAIAIEDKNSSSSPNHLVDTLRQIFLVYKDLDEISEGLEYLIDAANICAEKRDLVDARQASLVYRLLGDTYYFHNRDVRSAMRFYTSAIRLFGWDRYDVSVQGNRKMQAEWYCKRGLSVFAAPAAA
jgi:tetratricopeptide (TPR) repeat protein